MLKFSKRLDDISSLYHISLDSLLEKCCSLTQLKTVLAQIIVRGSTRDNISLSKVISRCALSSFADMDQALHIFDNMPEPNRLMYNTLIRASSNNKNYSEKVLFLYEKMVSSGIWPNEFTFPFVLKACASRKAYLEGIQVHAHTLKLGYLDRFVNVQNAMVSFYVGCGQIEFAKKIFVGIELKTIVSWNTMIGGYAKMGLREDVLSMFDEMKRDGVEPDGYTYVGLLSVCSRVPDLELGLFVHWYIIVHGVSSNIYMQNALLDMYAKCGRVDMAEAVFEKMVDRNVVSWTSMIGAYAKHGSVSLANSIFTVMPMKNVVSWNSMISCYLQNGHYRECLKLFYVMCESSEIPDNTTMVGVLTACGQLGDLVSGDRLHDYIQCSGIKPNVTLTNSLIDMYAKCGSAEKALDIFLSMPEKSIVSWNTIINALALHGFGHKAVQLFQEMETRKLLPDAVTFSGLLSACCHCGLIELGQHYFDKMRNTYRLDYDIEHYACMVDMLGRRGLLNEALELVGKMTMNPDIVVWGTLLGACRIYRNVRIAKLILKQLLELETDRGGLYVLLSNIFSEAQQWEATKNMRRLMVNHGVKKSDAVSSIEVGGHVYEFMVDDMKHESANLVYTVLNQLKDQLKCETDVFNQGEEIL